MDIHAITLVVATLLALAVVGLALRIDSKNKELRLMRSLYLEEAKKHESANALLSGAGYKDAFNTQVEATALALKANADMKYELGRVDFILNVPALESQKTRTEKLSLAIRTLRIAAKGGKVSNKAADCR
jgi:hypothetical protein